MIIFGGVDGTGVRNDKEYERTFENSFVNILFKGWTHGPANYERGPVTLENKPSDWTFVSAYKTCRHVINNWKAGESAVFLAGYSRGAAAVIEVAKWLKDKYIPVECLILFDPVDRTNGVGLPWRDTPIVDTVKTVIFAKRSPTADSREISMGNCGLKLWNGLPTPNKEFFATHGGLGGVPWPWPTPQSGGELIDEGLPDGMTRVTYERDRLGSNAVQQWSFNLIEIALSECKKRMSKPDRPIRQPGTNPGQPVRIHIVRQGDWLSKIAITYYGDMNKWPVIYNHPENRRTIGPDYNLIKPGQKLVIP
jgi:hypothetical protein